MRWIWILILMGGCRAGGGTLEGIVETITDPNTIETIGKAATGAGQAINVMWLVGIGVVLSGLALIFRRKQNGQ